MLLVHGTFTDYQENFSWNYGVQLPADGYDFCWVNLPNRSLDDIQVASEYVVYAVRQMYQQDGGRRIGIVGHSQGALEPRWALRWWPSLRTKVADMVSLAGPNHGTLTADFPGSKPPAAWQMATTAKFIAALNSVSESPPPVSYTSVYSMNDELVIPEPPVGAVARINGASNVLVQDVCPGRPVDHVGFAYDRMVYDLVRDALDHHGAANPVRVKAATPSLCSETYIGNPTVAIVNGLTSFLDPRNAARYDPTPAEPPLKAYVRY